MEDLTIQKQTTCKGKDIKDKDTKKDQIDTLGSLDNTLS
jgi:hypothetical protein